MNSVSILTIPNNIHTKYSSSQVYFYSKTIQKLVEEKRSLITVDFQDTDYFIDDD